MTDTTPPGDYYATGDNDTGQAQGSEVVMVHIASSDAKPGRRAAAEYGDCMNWSVDTFANMGKPLALLQRRYRRTKARIYVPNLGGPILASAEQSLEFQGQAAAPAANGNVVNVAAGIIPPGTYQVAWTVELDGTPGAGDIDNFKLTVNGSTVLVSTNDGAVGRYIQPTVIVTVQSGGGAAIKAVAIATAGSIYSAQMVFTPVLAPTAAIVFNSRQEPLMQAIPVGYYVTEAPYELQWENQKPCYAVLQPGGVGPISISVLDQAYEET